MCLSSGIQHSNSLIIGACSHQGEKKWKEELIDKEMYYSYPKDDIRLQRKKSYMQHHADSVSLYASPRRKIPSLHLEKTVLILKYF